MQENADYNKFRNKDLSLIWFRYDKLFSDVAATGERARAPNQRLENDSYTTQEDLNYNVESNETEGPVDIDDTDDNNYTEVDGYNNHPGMKEVGDSAKEMMFPTFTIGKRKSREENNKVKKKISGAASLKEDIRSLLQFMEKKSATISTSSGDITIAAAIEMLSKVPGVTPSSELWFYASNLLSKKEMREVFANQPSDECRLRWLEYNHDKFKKSN